MVSTKYDESAKCVGVMDSIISFEVSFWIVSMIFEVEVRSVDSLLSIIKWLKFKFDL